MSKKILMIDDDPDFIAAVQTLLEAKDYVVVTASNGQEGLLKAKEEKPDLITLDVMMTNDSEGLDVSKKFKEDEALNKIPIIIVSGVKKIGDSAYNYETGEKIVPAKAFVEKPIDPVKFLETIEKYIN
ncbi:MAG: response regulator [Candidatus Omnitrophica bacterium]|nr:response regulator [Candidatus Omnitrophota bacterium]MBU1996038.1 response regulator [Candidatus Omnitrophota bacterium]